MFTVRSAHPVRQPRLLVCAIGFILVGAAFTAPSVAATTEAAKTPQIIGLGDSLTSGLGTSGVDKKSGGCYRTTKSYPLLAARELGMLGGNAACAGARSSALTKSYNGQLPQASKVGNARFVVLTIGGADVFNLQNSNLALDEAKFAADLKTMKVSLASNLEALKTSAPKAEILLLAYPEVLPATNTTHCSAAVKAIIPQFRKVLPSVNAVLKETAKNVGVNYVDTSKVFDGHGLCSSDPWVVGPQDTTVAALHPNEKGHAAYAKATVAAIRPLMTEEASTKAVPTAAQTKAGTPAKDVSPTAVDVTDARQTPAEAPASKVVTSTKETGKATSDKAAVLGQGVEAEEETGATLAETGRSTTWSLAFGSSLMGIGLGLVWLRIRMEEATEGALYV